jgi:hypothetical protein
VAPLWAANEPPNVAEGTESGLEYGSLPPLEPSAPPGQFIQRATTLSDPTFTIGNRQV